MRARIFYLLLFLISFSGFTFGQAGSTMQNDRKGFPAIEYLLPDSSAVKNTSNISRSKPVIFLFFQTTCDHCRQLTKDIVLNKDKFSKFQLVMLTIESTNLIRNYFAAQKLSKIDNLIIGKDYKYGGIKKYQFESFPYCVIFSRNRSYMGSFEREFSVSSILKILK